MGAPVLEGMKGSLDIEQRHIRALQHDTGGLSRRKFVGANGFHRGILGSEGLSRGTGSGSCAGGQGGAGRIRRRHTLTLAVRP
jgi:hypothetical protein